jgi:hypothetical protein
VGTTLTQATNDRGRRRCSSRRRSGRTWAATGYLLAGIDVPVTNPQPYDFQPTVGLMKVSSVRERLYPSILRRRRLRNP